MGIFVLWVGRRLHSHQVSLNFLNSPMTRTLEEGDKKIGGKDDERHKLELKTTEDFLYKKHVEIERHHNCMACLKLRFMCLGQK